MNCSKCNTLIPSEASFCPGCGTPVEKEETPCVKKHKCNVWIFISVFATIFVVVIIFAALVSSSNDEDKIARLVMDIKQLDYALQQYKLDVGTYPSDLHCLLENIDQSDKWSGPYLLSEIPCDPWCSEYQYIVPGEYDDFDLYSFGADKREGGNGINADFSKHPGGLHYPFLPDWRERMIAESKGQLLNVSSNRHDYDKCVELPENAVFKQMAEQEAMRMQYDDLRRRGYNSGQIANYIMKQKYLPLIRHVTGKQNIIPTMKLTDEHWNSIKSELLKH